VLFVHNIYVIQNQDRITRDSAAPCNTLSIAISMRDSAAPFLPLLLLYSAIYYAIIPTNQ
jgi:hypothetical protein